MFHVLVSEMHTCESLQLTRLDAEMYLLFAATWRNHAGPGGCCPVERWV